MDILPFKPWILTKNYMIINCGVILTQCNYICILVLMTVKMGTCVAETHNKITFVHPGYLLVILINIIIWLIHGTYKNGYISLNSNVRIKAVLHHLWDNDGVMYVEILFLATYCHWFCVPWCVSNFSCPITQRWWSQDIVVLHKCASSGWQLFWNTQWSLLCLPVLHGERGVIFNNAVDW